MIARERIGQVVTSLGLLALGAFVLVDAGSIGGAQGYGGVGPRAFPYVVGAGLAASAVILLWHSLAGGWRNLPDDDASVHASPDWIAFAWISAGLVLQMLLSARAGFIVAGVVMFMLVARGFGSKQLLRDVIVAMILVTLAYLTFTRLLGLSLPAGVLFFL